MQLCVTVTQINITFFMRSGDLAFVRALVTALIGVLIYVLYHMIQDFCKVVSKHWPS
jgi:hypothetical protein